MLISRRYRFIFVHIYKNAGSSIRAALRPFVFYNRVHKIVCELYEKVRIRPPLFIDPEPFSNKHPKAQAIIDLIGKETFDGYFSFAIVRNPWDWQVSLYNYMLKEPAHHQHELAKSFPDFAAYLRWRCAEEVRFQKDFICSANGELLVDFVGRYEKLDEEFRLICDRIGIRAELPRINVSKTRPYQEYYTPESIELVRSTFRPDIELFDYDFE